MDHPRESYVHKLTGRIGNGLKSDNRFQKSGDHFHYNHM